MIGRILAVVLLSGYLGSIAHAQPLHWWRLEASPEFHADSIGTADLAPGFGQVNPVTLPAGGRGADFPAHFSLPDGGSNLGAAEFDASGGRKASFGGTTGDFTIEAFIHVDALFDTFGHTIAANTGDFTVTHSSSWFFHLRTDGLGGTDVGELILAVSPGSGAEIVGSGFVIPTGKDYYVAAAFDLAGGTVTYYAQNLSDAGPLQQSLGAHSQTSLGLNSQLHIGGDANALYLPFDGLIDEVRFSEGVLSQADLLVNNTAPPPPPVPLASPVGSVVLVLCMLASAAFVLARPRFASASAGPPRR